MNSSLTCEGCGKVSNDVRDRYVPGKVFVDTEGAYHKCTITTPFQNERLCKTCSQLRMLMYRAEKLNYEFSKLARKRSKA
jgi:hypothetical protein